MSSDGGWDLVDVGSNSFGEGTMTVNDYGLDAYTFRGRWGLAFLLRGLGLESGDRVVTQAFTCCAVPEGIMSLGCTPVYADIENEGYNLCPEALEHLLEAENIEQCPNVVDWRFVG